VASNASISAGATPELDVPEMFQTHNTTKQRLLLEAPEARHRCSNRQRGIPKLRRSGIFWNLFPKMSRLTALGLLPV